MYNVCIILLISLMLLLACHKDNIIDYMNPKDIKLSPDLTKNEIKKIKMKQNILTDALADLVNICNKNNISFFTDGGTLLGTLRHRGWIPWDDDIDVVMWKEDIDNIANIYNNDSYLRSKYIIEEYDHGWKGIKIKPKDDLSLFIDVFTLLKVKGDLYDLWKDHRSPVNINDIYPLKDGARFENIPVLIPNNPEAVLSGGWINKLGTTNLNQLPHINKRKPFH
jgi:hypothetical protein